MGLVAIILLAAYLTVTLGVRAVIQYRLTGSTGIHGVRTGAGVAEWTAAVLIVLAALGAVAAPVLDMLGVLTPVWALDGVGVRAAGLALYGIGFALTFAAQMTMGKSWRVGVVPDERTELVVRGLFRVSRNPIFSAMVIAASGLALVVGNVVALLSVAVLVAALELQVRHVEEPYLLRVHGEAYQRYAAWVGRFVPWLGRFR